MAHLKRASHLLRQILYQHKYCTCDFCSTDDYTKLRDAEYLIETFLKQADTQIKKEVKK